MWHFFSGVSLNILRQEEDLYISHSGEICNLQFICPKKIQVQRPKKDVNLKHVLKIFWCLKRNKIRRVESPTFSLLASILMCPQLL